MKSILVPLHDRSYSIHVGSGILEQLGSLVFDVAPSSSYFFVLDTTIEDTHGLAAVQSFTQETDVFALQALETNKTIATIQDIWASMLTFGCDRTVPVIAVGGGLVGDVGGFAAATYMRGVPLIQVPTTLLAMVDASIGGKTGINLPLERPDGQPVLGKNLAGSFWQPKVVVADVDVLQTLDDRQLRCGLAECVKHAMLGHDALLEFIEQHVDDIFTRDTDVLIELVVQCATIKVEVVAADERESNLRALLNLGHTFAHAIEPLPELGLFHGEAVSIGLCASVSCGEAVGTFDADAADRIRQILTTIGLPTRLPLPVQVGELLTMMKSDKKTINSSIRLVLPSSSIDAGASIVNDVDVSAISLAWTSVGASA
jgi:3-dehydroquinate synthase